MKDFAWHKAKDNPLWREPEKKDWVKKIKIGVGVVAFLGTIYLGIFSSIFHIKQIETEGLQRIKKEDFTESVKGLMNYKKLFIFPDSSYFLVDLNEIIDILKNKFSLNSITIEKRFPDFLKIKVEEKISTIIYDNSVDYSYLDIEGKQVELLKKVGLDEWQTITPASSSTLAETIHIPKTKDIIKELGDYPIVYDKRHPPSALNQPILNKNIVKGIIDWFNYIKKENQINLSYFIIENELGEGLIKTGDGWVIKANLKDNLEAQFDELSYLLKKKIDLSKINYIDLRYLEKVYWR